MIQSLKCDVHSCNRSQQCPHCASLDVQLRANMWVRLRNSFRLTLSCRGKATDTLSNRCHEMLAKAAHKERLLLHLLPNQRFLERPHDPFDSQEHLTRAQRVYETFSQYIWQCRFLEIIFGQTDVLKAFFWMKICVVQDESSLCSRWFASVLS